MTRIIRLATLAIALAFPIACAAEYRATGDPATVLYDAPSARAKPMFVYGRDVPVEVLVVVEGWTKVRDVSGTIGWVATKSLSDKRMVEVRGPGADVRASADDSAPVVFRADQDLLLELAEPAASPAAASAPGWVKVRHRDGQTGYVRLSQVFGF
ncbi:MAG TPA: SH3 domain-containing protein [Casimicrobiaceae bacterium]|nr:SH3 domain-containing protein [Casimicrobiaceae bacterium]